MLLRNHRDWLRGARVGLVAHPASRSVSGRATPDVLRSDREVNLVCLFGPEHGFQGKGGPGQEQRDEVHPRWRLPVYSLYGETRRPTAEMMEGVDVVLFDLQDLATRCYTYVSTLRYVLEAAAEFGKTVIVADRPVPLAGTLDGPMLEPAFESFVGAVPAPLLYGMTPGETATWLTRQLRLDLDLRVSRMGNYTRGAGWPYGLPWTPPSPAIRSLVCAWVYAATVSAEALPALDCRRHNRNAFQVLCAEWIRPRMLCDLLNRQQLPGIRFLPYTPSGHAGVRLQVEAPAVFQPASTGVTMLCALRDLYGSRRLWKDARANFFDLLWGTDKVRKQLRAGDDAGTIIGGWERGWRTFREQRAEARLYAEHEAPPRLGSRAPRRKRLRPEHSPRKAVVLAAGFATRMVPLSHDMPKALMPLWGKPMLQHVLEQLASWGVKDVVINCHHQPSEILAFARRFKHPEFRVALSFEPEILGTGGALRRMEWFFDDEPFWLLNADIACDLDPGDLIQAHQAGRNLATLWMHPSRGPRTVEMERSIITNFRSASPGGNGAFTFCGLHLVSPQVLKFLPAEGFASIIAAYEKAMQRGHRVKGVCLDDAYWADIGTPAQYIEAHREIRNAWYGHHRGAILFNPDAEATSRLRGAQVSGFATAGQGVSSGKGTILNNAVLWDGARVGQGVTVSNAIVGRCTEVLRNTAYLALPATVALDITEQAALCKAGWDPSRTTAYPLGIRGSARTMTRLIAGKNQAVLVRYRPERVENTLYAQHARFLEKAGVPVARVVLDLPAHHLTLFEDLGSEDLEHDVPHVAQATVLRVYKRVLDAVVQLHEQGTRRARRTKTHLMPPFDEALFRWEVELFAKYFLKDTLGLSAGSIRRVGEELAEVGKRLSRAPRVLVHRDLQSSNILLKRGRPYFIDFQGMRWGPASYDLASLLCDPYVSLPGYLQDKLLTYYCARAKTGHHVLETFWWAAVQRLCQAVGAYVRLSRIRGAESFAQHVGPAMGMLERALRHTEPLPRLNGIVAKYNSVTRS